MQVNAGRSFGLVALLVLIAVLGCNRPASTSPTYVSHTLDNGRYIIEVDDTQGGSSLDFASHSEGDQVVDEHYSFKWGGSHQLQIDDGKLTIDGKDAGTVEPGAKIKIDRSGKVFVNGQPR